MRVSTKDGTSWRNRESMDLVAGDSEAMAQVDRAAWEIAFEPNARNVPSLSDTVNTPHLGGVLADRCDVVPPVTNLLRAASDLPFINQDAIIGEQADDGVQVAG